MFARLRAIAPLVLVLGLSACASSDLETERPSPAARLPGLGQTERATPEQLCQGAEVRSWTVLANGVDPVAITRGQCLGREPARGWHFVSQLQDLGADAPTYELHLWLEDDGSPRQAQLRTATRNTRYYWTPEGLREEAFGESREMNTDGVPVWVIPAHALYIRELMLRLGVGVEVGSARQLGLAPERDEVIPLDLRFEGKGADRRAASPVGSFALQGDTLAALHIGFVTDREGIRVYDVAAESEIAPSLPESPTPTYVLPDGLKLEPVTIGPTRKDPDAPELAGELVMADDGKEGKRPAVVFFSGSGPQTRYGFVPATSIDVGSHELHDALAAAGFVVLRYDDRGVGESKLGPTATPGYQAFVEDARRATDFLADRPEVDPSKIIIIGHSEGALTASILGAEKFGKRRRRPAGIVYMAGSGRNLREVIYAQIRDSMTEKSDAEIEEAIAAARKIHDAAQNDGDMPATSEPLRDWMKEIFAQDPVANLKKLSVPVFAVQGAKDFQVDPKDDFGPVTEALGKAPKGSDSRLYEGLDHLFKPEPGESKVGHYYDLSRRVDPKFIADVVAWCSQRAGS